MSTHPCPTCGHVHEAPPTVDWTGYEDAVRELVAAWTEEQEHLLDCWREGVPSKDHEPTARKNAAEQRVRGFLSPIMPRGYLAAVPPLGSVMWFPYGGGEQITLYTHDDGPIRPDGA